ncbi:het-domain-containing protein [Fusarium pseudoanthophilum]|uniref:Het-domain-containing protein n=1 Tax=Fusarium pseudoanthophilum TaxID=48495 RepID=A0A8H5NW33_9HYPO|nr:het-domain-containing protein [Fusarium pseudoanthophilum]
MAFLRVDLIEPPKKPTYTTKLPQLKYDKLPTPTSIRLLKIDRLPSIKYDMDLFRPITCSLVVKDLNDRPKYNTLSYTWGDPLGRESSISDSTAPGGWATTPFDITCNGQRAKVTTNLHTALIAIRYHLSKPQTPVMKLPLFAMSEFIWVDQICINQADISEKGSQVQLMGRIYRECILVHVWLGGYRKDIKHMQHVMQSLEPLNWEKIQDRYKYKSLDMVDPQTWRVLGIRPITRRRARGMIKFFNRAWFRRSWIIQEELLAPISNALFGSTMMHFQVLIGFMAFMNNTGWFEKLCFQMKHDHLQDTGINLFFTYLDRVAYSLGIRRYHKEDQYWGCSLPMNTITRLFRSSEATDPRDKVYAFIGIAKNDTNLDLLVPDYTKSVESVYIDATKLIMTSKGFNLEIFSQREDEALRGIKSLPSWVPDFSVSIGHSPMVTLGPMWTAAGLKAPKNDIRFLPSSCIELHGVRVDTVRLWKGELLHHRLDAGPKVGIKKSCELVYISTNDIVELMALVPESSVIGPPTSGPSLADEFHKRNGSPNVLHPIEIAAGQEQVSRYQSRGEVFWRTMLQDTADNNHPARDACGKDIFKDMQDVILFEMNRLISDTTLKSMNDKSLEEWGKWEDRTDAIMREFTNLQILKGVLPYGTEDTQNPKHFAGARNIILTRKEKGVKGRLWKHFLTYRDNLESHLTDFFHRQIITRVEVLGAAVGRGLFATFEGRLGSGLKSTREGDEVWILDGCQVPCLLRPTGDGRYKLVGEAYVHGIMHGEALERSDVKELNPVIIV